MNVILNPTQSGTKQGDICLPASVDLTGKEGYLLKIVNDGGVAKFALPTAAADIAPYICNSGDEAGKGTFGECPHTGENFRCKLTGTCVPGDKICSYGDGTVYAPAAGAGALVVNYIAEEKGVAGQFVLLRKIGPLANTF